MISMVLPGTLGLDSMQGLTYNKPNHMILLSLRTMAVLYIEQMI
jgi:hypothetical protein